MSDEFEGFMNFAKVLNEYADTVDNILDEEEKMAKEFVDDLHKLPSPRSKIIKSGYTHLIDSISYEKRSNEVVVGWGKYYGRMVEFGTRKMQPRKHMNPTWNQNKEKYFDNLLKRLNLK